LRFSGQRRCEHPGENDDADPAKSHDHTLRRAGRPRSAGASEEQGTPETLRITVGLAPARSEQTAPLN
jgi:hypothetical protein